MPAARSCAAIACHNASTAGWSSGKSYIGSWAIAGISRAAAPGGPGRFASELARELPVLRLEALVGAEEGVLRHVGRIPARRRGTAERLGDGANVMRHGAATDAEIARAEFIGGLGELGDLEAVAGHGVERDGERHLAGQAIAMGIAQRLEGRLALV